MIFTGHSCDGSLNSVQEWAPYVWMQVYLSTETFGYHLAVLGFHETTGRFLQSFLPWGRVWPCIYFHKWPERLFRVQYTLFHHHLLWGYTYQYCQCYRSVLFCACVILELVHHMPLSRINGIWSAKFVLTNHISNASSEETEEAIYLKTTSSSSSKTCFVSTWCRAQPGRLANHGGSWRERDGNSGVPPSSSINRIL